LRQEGAYSDLTADIWAYVNVAFLIQNASYNTTMKFCTHLVEHVCMCARARVWKLLQRQSYAQLHIIYIYIIIELYNISSWCSTLKCM